jgi:glycosyltransferase domain-containing protein
MTSSPRSRYTLLIPTYNRPAYLRSLLGYLAARRFEYPIRVLDSSAAEALSQNREAISQTGLDVTHQAYDTTIVGSAKIAHGTQAVETPYCSLCADDDILFTSHLDQLLDLLDAQPTLAAAHGYYINFKPGDVFDISDIFYWAASLEADDPLKRIVEQMGNYQAIFYAIHRTSKLRSVLSQLERVQSALAKELLSSSLTLIAGGVCRIPHFYMARNTSPSIPTEGWHPHQFLATKPDSLFREYEAYRAVVVEHLLADAQCRAIYSPEQLEQILDLVHLKYLTPMISPPAIDYILAELLRPGREPGDIMKGVSDNFTNQYTAAARGYLRRALSQPRYALKLISHAVRLFSGLRLRETLSVSVNRGLDKMYIDRVARDNRRRRYVLFPEFLIRQLLGGRRVTAFDIRSIVQQLDDYV